MILLCLKKFGKNINSYQLFLSRFKKYLFNSENNSHLLVAWITEGQNRIVGYKKAEAKNNLCFWYNDSNKLSEVKTKYWLKALFILAQGNALDNSSLNVCAL